MADPHPPSQPQSQPEPASAGPDQDFVRLFTQSQRALYLSILPLVHSPADAEEVLQEANIVILSKWCQFTPGSNFLAWCRASRAT
ncbi:MAG UNVERIFIED_CONTAM: hypothetical protein LVR18_28895 [Planctomycetaceae bacterium]|jgi:RNA polymerase sigma-70 factor (ECF subfamily)